MTAWVDKLGAITVEALAEREQLSIAVARDRLEEAVELEFLDRHSVLAGYSDLYVARAAGRRLARKHADAGGYSYPRYLATASAKIGSARRKIARAGVAGALERRYPDHRVIAARELHREETRQGRRLASVQIRRGGRTESHFPDLVIWPPALSGEPRPLPIAVEIELAYKRTEKLSAICRGWARSSRLEAVLYYVETAELEERLLDAVERLKAREIIVVNPLSAIVRSLPGFDLSPWPEVPLARV